MDWVRATEVFLKVWGHGSDINFTYLLVKVKETRHLGKSLTSVFLKCHPSLPVSAKWVSNDLKQAVIHPSSPLCGRRRTQIKRTNYCALRAHSVNRVWKDLHGAVQSNAACFGNDIILITSHTGWPPPSLAKEWSLTHRQTPYLSASRGLTGLRSSRRMCALIGGRLRCLPPSHPSLSFSSSVVFTTWDWGV